MLGGLPPDWDALGREDAEALGPPDGAKERVQRRVALTLGLGAAFVAATAASSTTAAAATTAGAAGAGTAGSAGAAGTGAATGSGLLGGLLAKKVLVLGVAAAVGVGGGTAAYVEVRHERARSRAAAVALPAAPAPVARPAEPVVPEPAPPEPAPEDALPIDTLGEERAMLDRARLDIAQGRLRDARSALAQHAEQYRDGQLAEEREALAIRLLVREGRESEARARAARFRKQHPRSIQLPGIAEALRERR